MYKRSSRYWDMYQFHCKKATVKFLKMNKLLLVAFVAVAVVATVRGDDSSKECKGPNEEYQCGSACQATCRNLGIPCPIKNIECKPECYCVPGYVRKESDKDECIPIRKCPKIKKRARDSSDSSDSDSSDSSDSR